MSWLDKEAYDFYMKHRTDDEFVREVDKNIEILSQKINSPSRKLNTMWTVGETDKMWTVVIPPGGFPDEHVIQW